MVSKRSILEWEQLIQEQQISGQTIKSWCEESKIKESTYYYWQSRVLKQKSKTETDTQTFVELPLDLHNTREIGDPGGPSGLKIHYKAYSLELYHTEDIRLATEMLRVLAGLC